jgi:hypothetical protein
MGGLKHTSRWRLSMWQPIRSDMRRMVGANHSCHRDALGGEVKTDTNIDTNWNEQRRTAADNSSAPAPMISGVLEGDEHWRTYCLKLWLQRRRGASCFSRTRERLTQLTASLVAEAAGDVDGNAHTGVWRLGWRGRLSKWRGRARQQAGPDASRGDDCCLVDDESTRRKLVSYPHPSPASDSRSSA